MRSPTRASTLVHGGRGHPLRPVFDTTLGARIDASGTSVPMIALDLRGSARNSGSNGPLRQTSLNGPRRQLRVAGRSYLSSRRLRRSGRASTAAQSRIAARRTSAHGPEHAGARPDGVRVPVLSGGTFCGQKLSQISIRRYLYALRRTGLRRSSGGG